MNYAQPIALGDIFDRTFKLIGKTFLRILIIAAILILPGSIVLIFGLDWFYSTIGEITLATQQGEQMDFRLGMKILAGIALLVPGIIIFAIAYTGARVAAISIACNEIAEKNYGWKEALAQTFQSKVWRALGQLILEFLLYIGSFVVFGVIIAIVAAASLKLGIVLLMMLFFGVFGVIAYLGVQWMFTLHAIAWEDSRVFVSFRRSMVLVSDHWWRTFGIVFLFTLLLGFAESLITTPLMFISMWKTLASSFQAAGTSGQPDPEAVAQMMQSIGFAVGIIMVFSTIFRTLIEPAYKSIMYFDLRARHGEFTEHDTPRPFASYFGQAQT